MSRGNTTYSRKSPGTGSSSRGKGHGDYNGMKRIITAFDKETFEVIRKRAAKNGTSFAQEVRTLVEWGLEA